MTLATPATRKVSRNFTVISSKPRLALFTRKSALGHNHVDTAHLLAGLVHERDGLAGQVLHAAILIPPVFAPQF